MTAVLILVPHLSFGCFVGLGVSGDVPRVPCSQNLRVLKPESDYESVLGL